MYAPILVTPPASLPVSIDEAKAHLRVDHDEDDTLIESLIQAAVSHLDGWTGILGRCLVEQTWRLDSDAFDQCLKLPLGPVTEIVNVTWRNEDGQIYTVDDGEYLLMTDAGGTSHVRFRNGYSFPGGLYERGAVAVTFKAGYAEVPAAIKVAILLMVGLWYDNREAAATASFSELPFAVNALLTPFRRMAL